MNACFAFPFGCGIPGGGIASFRNFRTTFSHTADASEMFSRFTWSSFSPAVLVRWLWQPTQY